MKCKQNNKLNNVCQYKVDMYIVSIHVNVKASFGTFCVQVRLTTMFVHICIYLSFLLYMYMHIFGEKRSSSKS